MRRSVIALASVILISGCGTMPGWPGYISRTRSDFDGSTEISVHPGHASGCCALGATWNNRAPDQVQIVAVAHGGYTDIASVSGLEFNVDGTVVQLDATQLPTQLESVRGPGTGIYRSSSRIFIMRRVDFDSMLRAKSLKVRLNTASGALEGDLLRDAYGGSAIEGFRKFAEALPR